jgi:hypothetical protein
VCACWDGCSARPSANPPRGWLPSPGQTAVNARRRARPTAPRQRAGPSAAPHLLADVVHPQVVDIHVAVLAGVPAQALARGLGEGVVADDGARLGSDSGRGRGAAAGLQGRGRGAGRGRAGVVRGEGEDARGTAAGGRRRGAQRAPHTPRARPPRARRRQWPPAAVPIALPGRPTTASARRGPAQRARGSGGAPHARRPAHPGAAGARRSTHRDRRNAPAGHDRGGAAGLLRGGRGRPLRGAGAQHGWCGWRRGWWGRRRWRDRCGGA